MSRILSVLLLCSLFFTASAQDDDSLFVSVKNKSWVLPYTPARGDNLFSVSRRFHVPPAVLGSLNNLDYKSNTPLHSQILVPIAAYNYVKEKQYDMVDALPLYYVVKENDDLQRISHLSGVSQQVMERWNHLPDNNIYIGSHLFVGWILYDATSGSKGIVASYDAPQTEDQSQRRSANVVDYSATSQNSNPESQWPNSSKQQKATVVDKADWQQQVKKHDTIFAYQRNPDTVKVSPYEQTYLSQTGNEVNVATEKGSVAFFNSATGSQNIYYAMHADLERGVIVKVHNPGNDKTIYAKIIGKLPATKQYYNCVLALSGNAREELGVKEDKAWCEVSHR